MSRPERKYREVVAPSLMKKFNYRLVMEVPHVDKIVINTGIDEAISDPKALDEAIVELAQIAGQAPVITETKKSIVNFKLREGMPIRCKATLRKGRMYGFMGKLVSISPPRARDFCGASATSFDGRGNYTLGIKEQLTFPEIGYDKISKVYGMGIVIVVTANTNEKTKTLLGEMSMPLKK